MRNRRLVAPILLCISVGLIGWIGYGYALRGQIGEDQMVFYMAARAWIEGDGRNLYDGVWLTQQINARFAGWLSAPILLHPWIYPPSYLVLMLPLGFLPFVAAFALLQIGSFIALAFAACSRVQAKFLMIGSLLLSPAASANVLLGQNAFLTGALLVGGAGLMRQRPVIGGILLGLLSYKPQFCLMVPIALVAERNWRAMAAAGATALLLALGSVAVFGIAAWQDWIALLTSGSGLFHNWAVEARAKGMSVYAGIVSLGGPPALANVVQMIAALAAAGAVYRAFRQPICDEARLTVLLVATFLAAPHAANYDAMILTVAATLVATTTPTPVRSTGLIVLATALWCSPLVNPPALFIASAATPLLLLTVIATILLSNRSKTRPTVASSRGAT